MSEVEYLAMHSKFRLNGLHVGHMMPVWRVTENFTTVNAECGLGPGEAAIYSRGQ